MSPLVTLAKYCEGKSGDAFAAGGNVRGSRGDLTGVCRCARRLVPPLRGATSAPRWGKEGWCPPAVPAAAPPWGSPLRCGGLRRAGPWIKGSGVRSRRRASTCRRLLGFASLFVGRPSGCGGRRVPRLDGAFPLFPPAVPAVRPAFRAGSRGLNPAPRWRRRRGGAVGAVPCKQAAAPCVFRLPPHKGARCGLSRSSRSAAGVPVRKAAEKTLRLPPWLPPAVVEAVKVCDFVRLRPQSLGGAALSGNSNGGLFNIIRY